MAGCCKADVRQNFIDGSPTTDGKRKSEKSGKHLVDLTMNRNSENEKGEAGEFNLKQYVHDRIIEEIFEKGVNQDPNQRSRSFGLYVMVLDNMATGIAGSCLKLHHLGERRVSLVENLERNRKPMPSMEAIYFMAPLEKSVVRLIEDFKTPADRLYKCAHVFFTRKCPEPLFDAISTCSVSQYIRTLKELNVGFFAEESHVFDFNMKDNFFNLYSPVAIEFKQQEAHDVYSQKLLTLCQTMQIMPVIHHQNTPKAYSMAFMAARKLEEEDRATNGALSRHYKPGEVVLLVVERSVDVITPLLHCMSLQGMVNDILPVQNNCFQFDHLDAKGKVQSKTVILDEEEDELWREIRHMHIADAARLLPKKFRSFLAEHHIIQKDHPTLKDMAEIMRAFPQFHKELSQFAVHMHLTEVCMQRCKKGLRTVVMAEQNLVTGINGADGRRIAQYMPIMAPILTDPKRANLEKLRLLLIYIILKNGLPESDIDKILDHSSIPIWFKTFIVNVSFLGVNILTRRRAGHNRPPVKPKDDAGYATDRWNPYIKDIMEDTIKMQLNPESFPLLENANISASAKKAKANKKGKGKEPEPPKKLPPKKLIVCFLGGVTYPEMAAAYEVSSTTGVDILIGADEILTPTMFLDKVQNLKRWSHFGRVPDELDGTLA